MTAQHYLRVLVERPGLPPAQTVLVEVLTTRKMDVDGLVSAIRKAVANWVKSGDEEAQALYEYAGDDLNIGDLASYLGSESLAVHLQRHGILQLDLWTPVRGDWQYDTPLIEPIDEE